MASWARRAATAAVVGGLALAFTVGTTAADDKKDEKALTIKEVMKAMNGPKGLVKKTADAAKAGKWEDAQKYGKDLKATGAALGKNDPPKGSKDSWEKFHKGYAEVATAIADAAEKKDADEVTKGAKMFADSCKACHTAHKK